MADSNVTGQIDVNYKWLLSTFNNQDVVISNAINPGQYLNYTDQWGVPNWGGAMLGMFENTYEQVAADTNKKSQFTFKQAPLDLFTLVGKESGNAMYVQDMRCLGRPVMASSSAAAVTNGTCFFTTWYMDPKADVYADGNVRVRLRMTYRLPFQLKRQKATLPSMYDSIPSNNPEDNVRGLRRQLIQYGGDCVSYSGEMVHEVNYLNLSIPDMTKRVAGSDEWFYLRTIRPPDVDAWLADINNKLACANAGTFIEGHASVKTPRTETSCVGSDNIDWRQNKQALDVAMMTDCHLPQNINLARCACIKGYDDIQKDPVLKQIPGLSPGCLAGCQNPEAYRTIPIQASVSGGNCSISCIQVQQISDAAVAKNFQQNCTVSNTTNFNNGTTPAPAPVLPNPTTNTLPPMPTDEPLKPPSPTLSNPDPSTETTGQKYEAAAVAYAKKPVTWVIVVALLILIGLALKSGGKKKKNEVK